MCHDAPIAARIGQAVLRYRIALLVVFALATLLLAHQATRLSIEAGFEKRLPLAHPYMRTFLEYQEAFGGANRLLIAVRARDGKIFTERFLDTLRLVTDAVFFLPGVNRASVRSIFTPNVRFVEVVDGGFAGGNVVPADFEGTPQDLDRVRENVHKAGLLGRLVASDLSAALVSADLVEHDPASGRRLDHLALAERIERTIREPFTDDAIDIHVIGFAKAIGDIADGAKTVAGFFAITLVITALLLFLGVGSIRLTLLALGCSLMAVVWMLGALPLLGLGLDPMSVLLPFLIFAIGASHGMQVISAFVTERRRVDHLTAARRTFRLLLRPGGAALLTDVLGFLAIGLIGIRILQELAVTATIGVGAIILTNLGLLPILLSLVGGEPPPRTVPIVVHRLRHALAALARPKGAAISLLVGGALLGLGIAQSRHLAIGDLGTGIAELRPDSRYNRDLAFITSRFAIGADVLQVIIATRPDGCIDHGVMDAIDRFAWHMANVPGVQTTRSLPQTVKVIHAGWNEGSLKWRVLPRHPANLAQAVAPIETSSGLLNADCSVMPVLIETADHRAATVQGLIDAVETYAASNSDDRLSFRLASGNLAVIAATNEVVAAAQFPILLYIFAAVIGLCALTFRSLAAVLCIVFPLGLTAVLVYALMSVLGIGLKISTLPVAALGVGIGVDYAIYLYARLEHFRAQGLALAEAYDETLRVTGKAILLTGLTLAVGTGCWVFSPLKFQADMGLLLAFVFLANMLGALLLLPALVGVTDRLRDHLRNHLSFRR